MPSATAGTRCGHDLSGLRMLYVPTLTCIAPLVAAVVGTDQVLAWRRSLPRTVTRRWYAVPGVRPENATGAAAVGGWIVSETTSSPAKYGFGDSSTRYAKAFGD